MAHSLFFCKRCEWIARSGRSPKMSDVSKSLRSLTKNERCERIAQVAHQKWAMWANRSGCSPKMSDHERLAQVAHQKWATLSKSLRSLTKNERIAHFFEQSAHSLIFSQKTSDALRNPLSKFPALSETGYSYSYSFSICSNSVFDTILSCSAQLIYVQQFCGRFVCIYSNVSGIVYRYVRVCLIHKCLIHYDD